MSMPQFPKNEPPLNREDVINQIISSIAMEELGLSHIINAEGEKLQYALGTLEGSSGLPLTMEELLKLNESVTNTLNSNMMNQFFLKEKLTKALSASIMQGPPGPTGPQGPATIKVNEKVEELEPGNPPYVINENADDPDNVILKFGIPRGATGDVGTILASYNTLAELETAHPTGKQGDAYLVNGVLYIWDAKEKKWKSTGGNLRGPTGPQGIPGPQGIQGPQGIKGQQGIQGTQGEAGTVGTLKGSYNTLAELKADHPSGSPGDMYYVVPDVYVWDEDAGDWVNVGQLSGPQGIQGPQGQQGVQGSQGIQGEAGTVGAIKASYESFEKLKEAHPTGSHGDMYYVEPNVFAWDVDANEWVNLGRLSGPQGIQGEQGAQGVQGIQGEQGIQGQQGIRGPQGPQGPEATSYMIIPFASTEAPKTYAYNGKPTKVSLLGFGYGDGRGLGLEKADYSIPINQNDYSFTLSSIDSNANKQLVFSLPFNVILKSIYITVGNWGDFPLFNPGTVFPLVQLFEAEAGTNLFEPIAGALAKPAEGIPATSRADTMRQAHNNNLNIPLKAGTRIAIGGMMELEGDNAAKDYWLYFTGGIGMAFDPNP